LLQALKLKQTDSVALGCNACHAPPFAAVVPGSARHWLRLTWRPAINRCTAERESARCFIIRTRIAPVTALQKSVKVCRDYFLNGSCNFWAVRSCVSVHSWLFLGQGQPLNIVVRIHFIAGQEWACFRLNLSVAPLWKLCLLSLDHGARGSCQRRESNEVYSPGRNFLLFIHELIGKLPPSTQKDSLTRQQNPR
jgi:hypothetical protein